MIENYDIDLQSIQEVRNLVRNGDVATTKMASLTSQQIDKIIQNMVFHAKKNAVRLAQMAVEETGFGIVNDKVFKNYAASALLYEDIKDMKTVGIIGEDKEKGTIDVAQQVGLIMGIVPSTNPTSTVIFKSIVALKAGNGIVFAPHPSAKKCTIEAARIMHEAAVEAGAPENIIGCVTRVTMPATTELMNSKEIKLIIATGGPGMVKAAYSVGKPAIGVGAGNSPAYIEKTADVRKAVETIIASKTFDNGTICASEQSIICEECNKEEVTREFIRQGGYFMTDEETKKVCNILFTKGHAMNAKFVGRKPQEIAKAAGFTVSEDIKVLIGAQGGVGDQYPLSHEKLTTVLAFYVVKDQHEACELSFKLLENGMGHTMSIHTNDKDVVTKFSVKPASRILVNTGGSQGGTGISTGLPVSFTLGCGTCGGSSVTENVSPLNLINVKRVAFGIKDVTKLATDDKEFLAILNGDCGCNTTSNTTSSYSVETDMKKCCPKINVDSMNDLQDIIDNFVSMLKNN